MLLLFVLLTTIPFVASVTVHHLHASPRIILGESIGAFPVSFYCTLYVEFPSDSGTSLCGCAVIGNGKVISAAHCFSRVDASDESYKEMFSTASVRFYGSLGTSVAGLIRLHAEDVRLHPKHSAVTLRNDIAVVRFQLPMTRTDPAKVILNLVETRWNSLGETDRLDVVGVGITQRGSLSGQDSFGLGIPHVTYLSRRDCENPTGYGDLLGWSRENHLGDVCAGPFSPCVDGRCADSCNGDSGGPLFYKSDNTTTILGIVSRGGKCGYTGKDGGRPGIYVPIHKHVAFITSDTTWDTPHIPSHYFAAGREQNQAVGMSLSFSFSCTLVMLLLLSI